ncbi:MAG: hypothetical protein H6719_04035 [Sandaracinaceae bacterium]|nr:hypothetical protein [Sandaracinaceae bacterium]
MRLLLVLVFTIGAPIGASAQTALYTGVHPIDLDGHWHDVEGPHEHGELLVGTGPFGEVDGVRVFLADPIAYGWAGAVWTFRGAHPLPDGLGGYCALSGDHRHAFAPEGSYRRASNGAHVYRGGMRGGLAMLRPAQTSPPRPIVVAPAVASPAPYLFWGCRYQLLPGARGSLLPTAFDPTCVPGAPPGYYGAGWAGSTGSAAPATPAAPPDDNWFDGNYERIRGSPVQHRRVPTGRSSRN